MSATVTRVPSVLSIHQLDDETMNDPKCSTVQKTCAPGQRLPTLSYAPKRAAIKAMKKVRSFGSFDDLKVPDLNDLVSEFGDGSSDVQRNNTNSERTSDDGSLSDGDTGSTGGGYVQDVSPFDRILLSAWEDRFAAGLFRYDVTACKTKVVPGPFGFVAQFNEGRATKKRPTEFSVDSVCQDYDGSKFNFTKADKSEILFTFRDAREKSRVFDEVTSDNNGAFESARSTPSDNVTPSGSTFDANHVVVDDGVSPTVILINVSPIEYGHVLLCPRVLEGLPQLVSPALLLPPLMMAAESRNPYFRVGYNSLGAYATINHLHFQAYYLMEAFPIERAPTGKLPQSVFPSKRRRDGIKVCEVLEYPVRCLCFERGDGFESLAMIVGTACQRLQDKNVPFNLLIADHGARVFLIPQRFSQRVAAGEVPEDVVATGVNPAVFEISGHLLYKTQDDYETCSQSTAERMLRCASLTETDFYETVARALDDEGIAPLPSDGHSRSTLQTVFSGKLPSIRGSVDGACFETRSAMDAAMSKVRGDVTPNGVTSGAGSSVSSGDDAVVPCG